ncbi:MAG TPA: DUF3142 domain-containing protein [Pyrinomonadaceae bacterium]|nr:DUF3142 domain-containing protein [Pyrinomonadaceae bacterium]
MHLPVTSKKSFAFIIACALLLLIAALALFFFARLQSERALARGGGAPPAPGARMASFPKLFLWAWERPEQLEFINPREVGVAFLSRTIYLRGDKVIERPRMQPLKVSPGTTLIAVVRIETVRDEPPTLSDETRAKVAEALLEASRAPQVRALQIDFDALKSERAFYTKLLQDVRQRLPQEMPLSITALASWCVDDNWLDGLPIDEAVPMLFQMGLDEQRIKSYLKQGGELQSPVCRLSKGVSTDELIELVPERARRTYFFNAKPWTEDSMRRAIERNSK